MEIDSIRLVVHRNGEPILDRGRRFTGGEGGYTWRVQMQSPSEEMQVRVELRGGGSSLYQATRSIRVRSSGADLTELMMIYEGPELVRKVEVGVDRLVFVREGAERQVQGNAFAGNGVLLEADRLSWSSTGAAVATVTSNGLVTGNGAGTAHVIASANGAADTLVVVVDTTVHRYSAITGVPASLPADGSSGTQITVTLRHQGGAPVGVSAGVVELTTTAGTLGPVTDHSDGSYTAVLTAGTAAGESVVSGTLPTGDLPRNVTVRMLPGPPDTTVSTIRSDSAALNADGVSTTRITVELRDVHGNLTSTSGNVVVLSTTAGILGLITYHGFYTATLTAPTSPGATSIIGTLNGRRIISEARVEFRASST